VLLSSPKGCGSQGVGRLGQVGRKSEAERGVFRLSRWGGDDLAVVAEDELRGAQDNKRRVHSLGE
jgi:hypothetical protein